MPFQGGLLQSDFFDFQAGKRLSVTLFLPVPFSSLHFKDGDLRAPMLSEDFANDFDVGKERLPHHNGFAVGKEKDLFELNLRSFFPIDLLHPDDVSGRDFKLLTARLKNRVQGMPPKGI